MASSFQVSLLFLLKNAPHVNTYNSNRLVITAKSSDDIWIRAWMFLVQVAINGLNEPKRKKRAQIRVNLSHFCHYFSLVAQWKRQETGDHLCQHLKAWPRCSLMGGASLVRWLVVLRCSHWGWILVSRYPLFWVLGCFCCSGLQIQEMHHSNCMRSSVTKQPNGIFIIVMDETAWHYSYKTPETCTFLLIIFLLWSGFGAERLISVVLINRFNLKTFKSTSKLLQTDRCRFNPANLRRYCLRKRVFLM